jgi:hypothetical protein
MPRLMTDIKPVIAQLSSFELPDGMGGSRLRHLGAMVWLLQGPLTKVTLKQRCARLSDPLRGCGGVVLIESCGVRRFRGYT